MTGFTGVLWDARTTERLAADLGAGPGPVPLAEAGLAWAAVATELAEASAEYTAILARLGVNWQSDRSVAAVEHLSRLGRWFIEAAGEATEAAARAEAQAAAVTVARLAMPNLAEIDLVDGLRTMATATVAVAPALGGAAAHAERAVQEVKVRAARVMENYEGASEPAARPWRAEHPAPNLVSPGPLEAEQAARETAARAAHTPPAQGRHAAPVAAPVAVPLIAGGIGERTKTRYAPTILASGAAVPVPVQAATPAPATTPAAVPPPVAPGAMLAGDDRVRAPRPATEVAAEQAPEPSSAAAAADNPVTWAELATSDQPVAQHVSPATLDPRYLTERLDLDLDGGHRAGGER